MSDGDATDAADDDDDNDCEENLDKENHDKENHNIYDHNKDENIEDNLHKNVTIIFFLIIFLFLKQKSMPDPNVKSKWTIYLCITFVYKYFFLLNNFFFLPK